MVEKNVSNPASCCLLSSSRERFGKVALSIPAQHHKCNQTFFPSLHPKNKEISFHSLCFIFKKRQNVLKIQPCRKRDVMRVTRWKCQRNRINEHSITFPFLKTFPRLLCPSWELIYLYRCIILKEKKMFVA